MTSHSPRLVDQAIADLELHRQDLIIAGAARGSGRTAIQPVSAQRPVSVAAAGYRNTFATSDGD
jgi:hypothetical protein